MNFLGQYVQAYSTDCMQSFGGTLPIACNLYPSYADLYFNASGYTQQDPVEGEYGGYNTSGYFYNSSICLSSQNQSLFCTVDNELFAVSDTILNNNWNYGVDGNAGQFGFGRVSPVWTMLGSPATKQFDVQLSNFNDYASWGASYTPASTANSMNVGGFTSEFVYSNGKSITPTITGSRFAMDEFAFGVTFANFTQSYSSILNTNAEYGINANASIFTMNFRGLGLPAAQYAHFSNLLSVVTKGESSCVQAVGGYCVLANTCAYY